MAADYIGWWAKRKGPWHLVESEVTNRIVTRCGRQLRLETTKGPLVFEVTPSGEGCEQCQGRIVRD